LILDRVTITGADDLTNVQELASLNEEFPFVEWGILVSLSSEGSPRFPHRRWIQRLLSELPLTARLSLHVCGRWTREILRGYWPPDLPWATRRSFERVQLNTHALPHEFDAQGFLGLAKRALLDCQVIVQMDGAEEARSILRTMVHMGVDAAPLFDTSGGAGTVPVEWPRPLEGIAYHGYAGGLGPDTLSKELGRIAAAAGDARVWIDMERQVRTKDEVLDMERVRQVLARCALLMGIDGEQRQPSG